MRETVTTVAEIAGAVCVTVGAALLAGWFGWIVAGVLLIAGGWFAAGEE